jgi:hypothetical protein
MGSSFEDLEVWKKSCRFSVRISREVNIFSDLDTKELIQELKSISKMLQSLHSSLKKL